MLAFVVQAGLQLNGFPHQGNTTVALRLRVTQLRVHDASLSGSRLARQPHSSRYHSSFSLTCLPSGPQRRICLRSAPPSRPTKFTRDGFVVVGIFAYISRLLFYGHAFPPFFYYIFIYTQQHTCILRSEQTRKPGWLGVGSNLFY